ncbi:hypothetical protein M569_04423, partial [Genlisea aurea]
ERRKLLHIVMFPWFAAGHLRPFFRLSKTLARRGHRISFISTPRNIQRLGEIPDDLSHLIDFVVFPMPTVEHLAPDCESSMDVPHQKQQLLKIALDLLENPIRNFLQEMSPRPDWILYDYASHWLPRVAQEIGISKAFFSLFPAAFMAFLGPTSSGLLDQNCSRVTAEDYTVVPHWIPFKSNMAFRLHEMTKNMEKDAAGENAYNSGTSDSVRFGLTIQGSDIMILRSCTAFEPEWFELIHHLYNQKPVIPTGVLPVELDEEVAEFDSDEDWIQIRDWLNKQKDDSLVYVALGTEAVLTHEEVQELAFGLEQSGLPFLWVLNRGNQIETLPNGFAKRVEERGRVYSKWAPQATILSRPCVGGFLTHCGWNSVTESLCYGRVLILFPVMNDQGLIARLLVDKRVGVEIPRNENDGSFSRHQVADALKMAMVSDRGRSLRDNAGKMKALFGDARINEEYMDSLI